MDYRYAAQRMSAARRSLMLPHSLGEAQSIAEAFGSCSIALDRIDERDLDDEARDLVAVIQEFMDTSEIEDPKPLGDPSREGTYMIKARSLTSDQQLELSRSVDELADWFDRKYWESHDRDR